MNFQAFMNLSVIAFSVLLAIMLNILPVPQWAVWYRPEWVVMVLIYWAMAVPYRISIGFAWLVGLTLDALGGGLLGEHALALGLVTYIAVKFHKRIRLFPFWQQAIVIFVLVLAYLGIIYCIQGVIGELPTTWQYWLPAATSMLLWPWVLVLLRDYRRRFEIA